MNQPCYMYRLRMRDQWESVEIDGVTSRVYHDDLTRQTTLSISWKHGDGGQAYQFARHSEWTFPAQIAGLAWPEFAAPLRVPEWVARVLYGQNDD